MIERVVVDPQEEEDGREREETVTVGSIVEEDPGDEEDKENEEGAADEREIWQATHVPEEELEATEGEDVEEVDLLVVLLELEGLEVPDKEKATDLP